MAVSDRCHCLRDICYHDAEVFGAVYKTFADQYFHAEVNAIILHIMISQPGDPSQPAVRPWFGTFFDRRSQHAADFWKKVWWKKGEGLIVIDLLPSSIYPSPFSERSEFNV